MASSSSSSAARVAAIEMLGRMRWERDDPGAAQKIRRLGEAERDGVLVANSFKAGSVCRRLH